MTAMLTALRTLDARLDRGELTPEEYARQRRALMSAVEDAETDFIDVTPRARPKVAEPEVGAEVPQSDEPDASSAAGLGLVVVLAVMGICIAIALVFLENMNLALTLGVTILAALCVTLLRHSEE